MRILKFGGTSVADAEAITKAGKIVARTRSQGPVHVVVSACGGVTDLLADAAKCAVNDYDRATELFTAVHSRHMRLIEALIPPRERSSLVAEVQVLFNNLEDVLHGVNLVHECSKSSHDLILSYGERLSARIVAAHLKLSGLNSRYVDARQLILTLDRGLTPVVDREQTAERIRTELAHDDGPAVVTGFIAADGHGVTTTLGRGASDFTAAIVGAAHEAEVIELYTDVDGIYNADPRVITNARVLTRMTFEEAQEMAYFGAKIVHPQALQPAAELGIPVVVRNTFNPEHPGTTICADSEVPEQPVRGITTIGGVALVNLEGSGMIGIPGIAGRLFTALADNAVNTIMISQASSEHSICFITRSEQLADAVEATRKAFEYEIATGIVQRIEQVDDLAILAVIGTKMRGTIGLSGSFFGALGNEGVNVVAISQGSSERNISIVISAEDINRAVGAVHRAFELGQ